MTPAISILLTMAPGREDNLNGCLYALSQQDSQDFEIIIADDGSEAGQMIANQFSHLPIQYLWRANDRCVSRSRNLAAAQAKANVFLFLDCDVLLNPHAVSNYINHFQIKRDQAIAGYMGCTLQYVSESVLLPGRMVNFGDRRIHKISRQGLELLHRALIYPYRYCWSANLATSKNVHEQVGGFDERYICWGGEDEQFGLDLIRKGFQLNFAIDTWGEHQVHPRNTSFHEQIHTNKSFKRSLWGPVNYRPQIYSSTQAVQKLIKAYFEHYLPNSPKLSELTLWQIQYPDAILTI